MYNIVRPDGVKVGPLDMITLLEWRNKGRLQPDTILEDVATGNRVRAKTLTNLFPPDATPEQLAPNAVEHEEPPPAWEDPENERPSSGQLVSMYLTAPFWLAAQKLSPDFRSDQAERELRLWNESGSGARMAVLLIWGVIAWAVIAVVFGLYR